MLDSTHADTFPALSDLCDIARAADKPIVVWIGAGASAWCGLPTWAELAQKCFTEFSRKETQFDATKASEHLQKKDYPALFGVCQKTSSTRYATILHQSLALPAETSPVYERFLRALTARGNTQIITTNADELLERGLGLPTILPSNLEIVATLIGQKKPFVAKLHGSISDFPSLVFTDEEYKKSLGNLSFRATVKNIFHSSVVLFIGYGLADEYVLRSISEVESLSQIFGSGPHFVCTSDSTKSFSPPLRVIRYVPTPHQDHRSSIQVLEELSVTESRKPSGPLSVPKLVSAHMLSDCIPAGTWTSSQRMEIRGENGDEHVLYHGHGLIQSELPFHYSTAMHDLVVGLVCFDRVYVPMSYLARLHDLVGGSIFAELIQADVLRFVRSKTSDAVIFSKSTEELIGQLTEISFPPLNPDKKELSLSEQISREIRPAPGREREALALLDRVEAAVVTPGTSIPVPEMVRSLLIRPSVRALLGMSQGTKLGVVPKWLTFPLLRFATVVRLGSACRELGLGSVKFGVGNDKLAEPVFAAIFGKALGEQVASYVVAGNFSTDLGAFIQGNPATLNAILRFRDTQEGQKIRQSVLEQLAGSNGADVAASINGGLNQIVGVPILESARAAFTKLCIAEGNSNFPAIWFDKTYSDQALYLWRQRSVDELSKVCAGLNMSQYGLCPCGSGDKLKFCCVEALARQR